MWTDSVASGHLRTRCEYQHDILILSFLSSMLMFLAFDALQILHGAIREFIAAMAEMNAQFSARQTDLALSSI